MLQRLLCVSHPSPFFYLMCFVFVGATPLSAGPPKPSSVCCPVERCNSPPSLLFNTLDTQTCNTHTDCLWPLYTQSRHVSQADPAPNPSFGDLCLLRQVQVCPHLIKTDCVTVSKWRFRVKKVWSNTGTSFWVDVETAHVRHEQERLVSVWIWTRVSAPCENT